MITEQEIPQEDLETIAFNDWADDNCEHNGFYDCNHPNKENNEGCFSWNCPRYDEFTKTENYKELQKNEQ